MKKYYSIYMMTLVLTMFLNLNKIYSQATSAGPTATNTPSAGGGDYLGWKSGTNLDLDINNQDAKHINFKANNTQRMIILGVNGSGSAVAGNVGIGTTSPQNLLHINLSGATDTYMQWTNGSTNTTNGLWCGINTNGVGIINMKDNQALNFYTNDARRMHFNDGTGGTSGYCSIGDLSSPQSRLHVREGGGNDCWLQLTGNSGGDGSGDGFKIGVVNTSTVSNEAAILKQQKTAPINFLTGGTAARMQIYDASGSPLWRKSCVPACAVDDLCPIIFYS